MVAGAGGARLLRFPRRHGVTRASQALVHSSFLWMYTLVQLQAGVLADSLGGRFVLGVGVVLFCASTAATPLAFSPALAAAGLAVPAVLAARALVGLGEGVALPAVTSLLAQHVPQARRAAAVGAAFAGFHGGTVLGLLVAPSIIAASGWRAVFYFFAACGVPVLAVWLLAVPPRPTKAGGLSAGRAPGPPPPSVAQLFASVPVRAIMFANVVNHFSYFVFLFLMPTYFSIAWGMDVRSSALFSLAPWVAMGVMSYVAGAVTDAALPRFGPTTVRKSAQALAFLGPAACLGLLLFAPTPVAALGCLTTALGLAAFGQAGFVSNISDVAPRHAGRLFGLANTLGCLAGVAGTTAAGVILSATGSFYPLLALQAVLYTLGALVYTSFASGEPQF